MPDGTLNNADIPPPPPNVFINHFVPKGLYRVSGNSSHIQALSLECNTDVGLVDLKRVNDINNCTGLMKLYFRELADPVFTDRQVVNACTRKNAHAVLLYLAPVLCNGKASCEAPSPTRSKCAKMKRSVA